MKRKMLKSVAKSHNKIFYIKGMNNLYSEKKWCYKF